MLDFSQITISLLLNWYDIRLYNVHILEWTHNIQLNRIKFNYAGSKIGLCACAFRSDAFPYQWQSWHSWMYSFQKHRCRHTQLAQWNWPVTTGCPHTDQSRGPPFQREPVCGMGKKTLKKWNNVQSLDAFGGRILTPSAGSVWCPSVQRCERCLYHWRRTGRRSRGWSLYWRG